MSYYNPGDEIIYKPKNLNAKIAKALPNETYVIEFDDQTLIPPQMEVPEEMLMPKPINLFTGYGYGWSQMSGHSSSQAPSQPTPSVDKDKCCPKCKGEWKITEIGRNTFYDCLKCNLKKEDA